MSVAVPDPRFRDQLAKWIYEKTRNPSGSDWGWWSNDLTAAADELLALFVAEVEARVQVAANQRAVEELEEMADSIPCSDSEHEAKAMLRARAAALASPAPALDAEGQP